MKKLFAVAALATTVTACQQSGPTEATTPAATPAMAVGERSASPTAAPATPPADAASADFLKRYNLAGALQMLPAGDSAVRVLNGFYGSDNYRMELALLQVRRDPTAPNRYLIAGKDRYKKIITPLTGTITLTKVQLQPTADAEAEFRNYAVTGIYELREDPTAHGAGVFRGQLALDVAKEDKASRIYYSAYYDTPAKGGGLLFAGDWTSLATGQRKPATWVAELFQYQGPQVADDFVLGERDPSINPKYAKQGWNHYWENDEWWVSSPGAVASK